jgi:S1-C subfamily serine protease
VIGHPEISFAEYLGGLYPRMHLLFPLRLYTLPPKELRMRYVRLRGILFLASLVARAQQPASANPAAQQSQPALTLQQFLDQFLLIVAPIEIWSGPTRLGTATGFFFVNEGRQYFVTNRHVVREEQQQFFTDRLIVRLHTNPQDNTQNSTTTFSCIRTRLLRGEKSQASTLSLSNYLGKT